MNLIKKKRKWIIGIVIFVLFLIVISYVKIGSSKNFVYVRAMPVRHGELVASISAIGTIKPSKEIVVRSQTEGIIDKVLVNEGNVIKKGAEIVHLDSLGGTIIITSPIFGTVLLKPDTTEIGVKVEPGQSLLTIGNLRRLIVEADINEVEAKNLKKGQQVEITSDVYPAKEFSGRIKRIAPQVHDIKGTAKIPVVIDVLSYVPLKPGNRVDIEIITDYKKDAYFVPLEAVVDHEGQKVVFFVEENRSVEKKIKTGISNIDFIEIIDENNIIDDNSRVIVGNNQNLKDGSIVKIY